MPPATQGCKDNVWLLPSFPLPHVLQALGREYSPHVKEKRLRCQNQEVFSTWETPPASRPPGDCRCSALGHLPHQVTKLKAQHVPVCLQPASALGLSVWRPPVGTLVLTQSTITDTQEKPGSCLPACVFREHQTPWESWDPDTWDQDP